MNKKVWISIIVIAAFIIVGSLGYVLFGKNQTSAIATIGGGKITAQAVVAKSSNDEGIAFIKKAGLTGLYNTISVERDGNMVPDKNKNLSVSADIIQGAMKSSMDPPPKITIALTNNTNETIKMRRKPIAGQYLFIVSSFDKNKDQLGDDFWISSLDLRPKETQLINVILFSSLETAGFRVAVYYYKE